MLHIFSGPRKQSNISEGRVHNKLAVLKSNQKKTTYLHGAILRQDEYLSFNEEINTSHRRNICKNFTEIKKKKEEENS